MKIETIVELRISDLIKSNSYGEILDFMVEIDNHIGDISFTKELVNRLKINFLD